MIIDLYDNEGSEYPMIEIKEDNKENFYNFLEEYQKREDYNLEEFLDLIKSQYWFIKTINADEVVFF